MLLLDERPSTDLRPLRAHCTGEVVVAGEGSWTDALDAWGGLEPGAEPVAVVYPASDHDVAAVRSYARYAGLDAVLEGSPEADGLPADLGRTVLIRRQAARPPWAA